MKEGLTGVYLQKKKKKKKKRRNVSSTTVATIEMRVIIFQLKGRGEKVTCKRLIAPLNFNFL